MRLKNTLVLLVLVVSAPVQSAMPRLAPVEIAPVGVASDPGKAVDLIAFDDGLLAIWKRSVGMEKYGVDLFTRPLALDGQPSGPQTHVAHGTKGATAASNGREVLVVWIGSGIEAELLGRTGEQVEEQRTIADRGAAYMYQGGVVRIDVAPSTDGWVVFLTSVENGFPRNYFVEFVRLDQRGEVIEPLRLLIPTGALLAATSGREGEVAVVWRDGSNHFFAGYLSGTTLEGVTSLPGGEASAGTLEWNGSMYGLALADGRLITLSEDLELRGEARITAEEFCRETSIAWIGDSWSFSCSKGSGPSEDTTIQRFSERAHPLGSATNVGARSITRTSYRNGIEWGLGHSLIAGSSLPLELFRISADFVEQVDVISKRSEMTAGPRFVPWDSETWFAMWRQEDRLATRLVPVQGRVDPRLATVRQLSDVPPLLVRHADFIYAIASHGTELTVLKFDRTVGKEAVQTRTIEVDSQVSEFEAGAGPAGVALSFHPYSTSGSLPTRTMMLLDHDLTTLAVRDIPAGEGEVGVITVLSDTIHIFRKVRGVEIEVFDTAWTPLSGPTSVVPFWTHPSSLIVSANGQRILVAWINSTDHIRTVVLDETGGLVSESEEGRIVTEGGDFKVALDARPEADGWRITWLASSDRFACPGRISVLTIEVDESGVLETPLPHQPRAELDRSFCGPIAVKTSGGSLVVAESGLRTEHPYNGATRFLTYLMAPEPRRRTVYRPD